ncbi:MAG: NifU family protein [Elusimicrobia bacterium]|nr:NifU family protein [Elusimicrobiota bacterium]
MKEKVQKVLDGIRPHIQADGGDIVLVGVDEKKGIVTVSLRGACGGCPGAQMTLKGVVERKIKEAIPEVKEVRAA